MEKVEKRNNYFYTSAILGIILACIEILCGIIAISIFFSMKETVDPTRVDFVQGFVVATTISLLVIGVLTIVVNCFFFKFAGYSQEKINNQTISIIHKRLFKRISDDFVLIPLFHINQIRSVIIGL